MNIAVILAGGVGSRVGAGMPKQFVKILGKPVIVYTIEAFQKHEDIDAIEVVCVKSHIDYMKELVDTYGLSKVKWITEGGADFQGLGSQWNKQSSGQVFRGRHSAGSFRCFTVCGGETS